MLHGATGPTKLRQAARETIGFYWGSGLSNEVPALAWFLLASLVPLALGTTAVATVLLGDYAKAQAVAEKLSQGLPHNVHEEIVQLILRTHRDSPLLIAGSIAGMLWTSSGAVGVLERSLSRLPGREGKGGVAGKLGNTPVELFLMLSGVLITCYLAALALLIGAGVTMRVQLGRRLADAPH